MQVTRLTSANNVSFSIATELAMMSPLIKAALSHETLEAKSNIVYLPDISEDALKDVIRFLKETYKDNSCKIFEPNPQYAIETLMAGIYLGLPFLYDSCIVTLAKHFCAMPPRALEFVPDELVLKIITRLKTYELRYAETLMLQKNRKIKFKDDIEKTWCRIYEKTYQNIEKRNKNIGKHSKP